MDQLSTRCCGAYNEREAATFTKEYTVGFKRADLHIPSVLWKFLGVKFDIQTVLLNL